jgi:hypothetical protein
MGAIREQLKYVPLVLVFLLVGLGFNFAPSATMGTIAAGFFVLALLCVIQDRRLARCGLRTEATVVDHGLDEDCFFPVVEFQDRDGAIRRAATGLGRGVKKPPLGSRVVVVYDPTGKGGCEIDRFWRRSGFAVALCLLGVAFGVGAIVTR